jgi:hypothetical protein
MDSQDREKKKAWRAREREAARSAFPLPDESLQSLFAHVDRAVAQDGCVHTLKATDAWIAEHAVAREPLVAWLRDHGGYCDCEVVANVEEHWQENR